ncbi:ERCC4 domain-containing protein [Candidatus Lokiarchaeum ossiferum]
MCIANTQFINHPLLKENVLLKRKFQVDIFVTCTKSNCLVVVPTGLGKTIIALLLSLQRLKNNDTKIIFLAPTRPLVEQHLRTFQNLTNIDPDSLLMMTGIITPEKRKQLYQEDITRCLFMTPQILQNDLISGRISLKNISLMIFDESHRATGNYAYTFLAKRYMQNANDPKILAMTASPGKNREKIKEVMQNLYLDAIEIRTDSDPDVKPYIQEVETIWKNVDLPEEMLEVLKAFENLQKLILSELKKNEILDSEDIRKISRKDLLAAGKMLDGMIIKAQQGNDLPRLLFCKKLLANAIRISHMSELLEAQGINSLKAYLDKNVEQVKQGKGGKSLKELFQSTQMQDVMEKISHLTKNHIDHPKMALLMSLLMEQFTESPDSRVLVFCHFRDTVKNIVEQIEKNTLIHPHSFVGQQKKGKEKGLSQKQQLEILQQFKSGVYNTLVATSVAEEGLDISECDVVIFFDVVPSEIRAIQRRGRTGRNRSGKVIIFKTMGTREEGYFWAEKHREKEMKRVLNDIRREIQPMANSSENRGQKSLTAFLKKTPNNPNKEIKSPQEKDSKLQNDPKEPNSAPDLLQSDNLGKISIPLDKSKPYILVDSRETASSVTRELAERNANVSIQKLPTGDYIISEQCGIERKSIPDFISSIKDGRLFNELQRLKTQFTIPILIIEGGINSITSINRAAVLGTLTSILLKMRIFLYQTTSPEETAEILIALAKKEQSDKPSKHFSIRFKKFPEKIPEQLEFIISGIPGINASRAKDLLIEFRTLRELLNANEKKIQKVPNIGPAIAQNIFKYANADYLDHGNVNSEKDE